MSAPCIDAPCCGCCEVTAATEPPEELERDGTELDDELDGDGELQRDLILDGQEREDFANDDLPESDDEVEPWDWVTD
jgi:hypothetical protein